MQGRSTVLTRVGTPQPTPQYCTRTRPTSSHLPCRSSPGPSCPGRNHYLHTPALHPAATAVRFRPGLPSTFQLRSLLHFRLLPSAASLYTAAPPSASGILDNHAVIEGTLSPPRLHPRPPAYQLPPTPPLQQASSLFVSRAGENGGYGGETSCFLCFPQATFRSSDLTDVRIRQHSFSTLGSSSALPCPIYWPDDFSSNSQSTR
jgi:hypothetical protein